MPSGFVIGFDMRILVYRRWILVWSGNAWCAWYTLGDAAVHNINFPNLVAVFGRRVYWQWFLDKSYTDTSLGGAAVNKIFFLLVPNVFFDTRNLVYWQWNLNIGCIDFSIEVAVSNRNLFPIISRTARPIQMRFSIQGFWNFKCF